MAKAYKCEACQKLFGGVPAHCLDPNKGRPHYTRTVEYRYGSEPHQFQTFLVEYTIYVRYRLDVPDLCQGCVDAILANVEEKARRET